MKDRTDEDLVKHFVGTGAREAFGELYYRYKDKVFNTAYRIVGDYERARDVSHDVFLKVHTDAGGFRFKSSFSSWIYRITVNRSLDESRRARRRKGDVSMDAMAGELSSRRRADRPEDAALDHESQSELLAALERLSPKLKAVIVLRYFEGLSYEQIAEVIEHPVGTVKSRLRRAHRKLAALLERRGYDVARGVRNGLRKGKGTDA